MDLLGTEDSPVISGYSIGGLDGLNPPGLCETNLSIAALNAETTFGLLIGNQTAAIGCNCLIGEGTEPTIFELFNEGLLAHTGAGGEQVFATADFDLRFEGNDSATCTSTRQHDFNRGKVGFLGIGCNPPANPICLVTVAGPFVTTPGGGADLVDSLCAVPLQLVGCGFFPNEVTIICQGFEAETGVPLQRPGKTVTTAATLSKGDDPGVVDVWDDVDERVPVGVLRRSRNDTGDDDVLVGRQQRVWTVHEDDDVRDSVGYESAGGVIGIAVERELFGTAGSVDLRSVFHNQRSSERDGGVCAGPGKLGDADQRDELHDTESVPGGCVVQLHECECREDVPDLRARARGHQSEPDGIAGRVADAVLHGQRAGSAGNVHVQHVNDAGTDAWIRHRGANAMQSEQG